ncbi:hypothetical protein [Streptomyces sp. KL116D]|uniref:hypothetical protein n=1 Tax=Streptomyces sp. KL116D TaxID=3045152 RepID=UPI0035579BD6
MGAAAARVPDTSTLPLSLHTSVLRHSLTAFMLRVAHVSAQAAADECRPQPDTTFSRFRTAVEQGFTTNHSVSAYADELGYSAARWSAPCARRPARPRRRSSTGGWS